MCRGGWTSEPEPLRSEQKAPVVHPSPETPEDSLRGLVGAAGGSVVKVESCLSTRFLAASACASPRRWQRVSLPCRSSSGSGKLKRGSAAGSETQLSRSI